MIDKLTVIMSGIVAFVIIFLLLFGVVIPMYQIAPIGFILQGIFPQELIVIIFALLLILVMLIVIRELKE